METGEAPQPTKLETARDMAMEKGAERRQEASRRISGFFSGIKEKITKGVDFALGSPDAASYLGTEAVKFGKEKATETRDAVVEAGTRAWESLVDAKDRLVKRGIDAKDRLVARYEQTRDATKARVADLSKRAAVWGLEKIAEPIEDRLQRIYEIPADIREWQGRREDVRAQKQETRAQLAKEASEARVEALQEEIARIREATGSQVDSLNGLRDAALARRDELADEALARREQAKQIFGNARAAVQNLQTR
jgi:hypothetical protein